MLFDKKIPTFPPKCVPGAATCCALFAVHHRCSEKLGKVTSFGDPSLNNEWAVLGKPPGEFWGRRWAPRMGLKWPCVSWERPLSAWENPLSTWGRGFKKWSKKRNVIYGWPIMWERLKIKLMNLRCMPPRLQVISALRAYVKGLKFPLTEGDHVIKCVYNCEHRLSARTKKTDEYENDRMSFWPIKGSPNIGEQKLLHVLLM